MSLGLPGNLNLLGSLSAAQLYSNFGSLTQAYASTLTCGSISTNFLNASTLSAGTLLNVVFSQTISSSGTTSSGISGGTLTVGGSASFSGSISTTGLAINQNSPLYTVDVTGSARISGSISTNSLSTLYGSVTTLTGNFVSFATITGTTLGIFGDSSLTGKLTVSGGIINSTFDGTPNSSNLSYFAPPSLSHVWYLGSVSAGNNFLFNRFGIYPGPDAVYNLGLPGARWNNLSLSGTVTASNLNQQIVQFRTSGTSPYVSNIPCYFNPGGGLVTVSCSYNYNSGASVAQGLYMLLQYLDTTNTWASSATTVVFLGGSNSWTFSNSGGFFAITCPSGNHNFSFSINHT